MEILSTLLLGFIDLEVYITRAPLTLIITVLTCFTSYRAFNDPGLRSRMLFSPYAIKKTKQYERFVTSGFIHANGIHLFFNMFVFFLFGASVEIFYGIYFGFYGKFLYLLLYFGGMAAADAYTYFRYIDNPYYSNLGASGAVSGVVFASILFEPTKIYYLYALLPIPALIFGIAYIWYSLYAAKNLNDNVAHESHLFGAVFGFIFTLVLSPKLLLTAFFQQISGALGM